MIQNYLDIFKGLSLNDSVLLAVFFFLFLLRFSYLFMITGRVLFRKKRKVEAAKTNPLSLILTVRNEEVLLKQNIPKILSLENVDFEMIIVDDFSHDNSYLVLGLLKERYKRLTISMLSQETRFSTKLATNLALKATKNNWILSFSVSMDKVQADWLNTISEETNEAKNVVVAYSNVNPSKNYYNYLFRIENYFQFAKSTSYILCGIPFIYSNENVAFRKEKYFESKGYGQKINEPYANLELLINNFIRKKTTSVLFNEVASVRKTELIDREKYYDLLKKSIRIEKQLPFLKRLILTIDEWSKLFYIPVAAFVIVLFTEFWIVFAGLLALKFITHLFIIKILQNRLNERKIFIPSLVYDLIAPYFKLFYRWHFNRRSRKNRWKSMV